MRLIVPQEGKRPSSNALINPCTHVVDNVEQFVLDFIGNLIRKKGDDGDVSASTRVVFPLFTFQLAPAAISLHGRVFHLSNQDGKISNLAGMLNRDTQDTPTIQ